MPYGPIQIRTHIIHVYIIICVHSRTLQGEDDDDDERLV